MSISKTLFSVLATSLLSSTALAGNNCGATGNLSFLGTSANGGKSVWLSNTSAGSFNLVAAQGNQTVDAWTKGKSGLHLSLSPVVSNGNGGTHKLNSVNSNGNCLLDTQNQKGGFIFPDSLIPPGSLRPPIGGPVTPITPMLPGGVTPPIGQVPVIPLPITPMLPGGVTPPIGVIPAPTPITPMLPGGVTPPIGVIPAPTPITPMLPGGVTPPIGVIPAPTPITPMLPGGVTPPIGVIPAPTPITPMLPGGVTPPIGVIPAPTPITPMLPGGVTPPIGVIPAPTPITPMLPGGVTPPIGVIPAPTPITPMLPGGVTPPIGVIPAPTPITPMLPGGVTPPIGVIPAPTPITPMLPGGVTPPIGVLPPTTPLTPMLPGGVAPPIAVLPPPGETSVPTAPGNASPTQAVATKVSTKTICPEGRLPVTNTAGQVLGCALPSYFDEVPLTEGRDLVEINPWNLWVDSNNLSINDQRNNTDIQGKTYSLSMGVDRLINNNFVAGMQVAGTRTNSTGFQGDLTSNTSGFLVGPYASVRITPAWSLYGSFGIGQQTSTTQILSLSGTSKSTQYNFALQAEGQYALTEDVLARPKVQLSQTQVSGNNYLLSGTIANTAIALNMTNDAYKFGIVQPSLEINKLIPIGGTYIMPYVEAGVFYQYARPQGGQILTSNLTYADTSPWGGIARVGTRALIEKATMAKLEFSYQSIGIANLNIWGLQLFLSHSF